MKHPNLDKLRNLRATAKTMREYWSNYNAAIANPNNDKYDAKFGGVSDRSVLFTVKTSFTSYIGQYGSSSVYGYGRVDEPLVHEFFVRAMNILAPELFAKTAELMTKAAANLEGEARKELAEIAKMLDEALADPALAEGPEVEPA